MMKEYKAKRAFRYFRNIPKPIKSPVLYVELRNAVYTKDMPTRKLYSLGKTFI